MPIHHRVIRFGVCTLLHFCFWLQYIKFIEFRAWDAFFFCQTDISGRTVAVPVTVPVKDRMNRMGTGTHNERGETTFSNNDVNHVNGIVMNHSLAVEKEELSLEYNYASGMSYGDVRKESQVNMD